MLFNRVLALSGLALLTLTACGSSTNRCKDSTLLVTISLDGESAKADALVINVQVIGRSPSETTINHPVGSAGGTVEVDFANYPAGQSATVTVTATLGGNPIASNSATLTLGSGCDATTVALAASAPPRDLAGSDLTPEDLQGVIFDLTPPPDLAKPDLTPPVDMACTFKGAEDCFNGIDDDCNGHIDCDDPACVPNIAVCVPDEPGLAIGVRVAAGTPCPSRFTNSTTLNQGLTGGAGCTGCSCSANPVCKSNLYDYGANTCPGSTFTLRGAIASNSCANFGTPPTTSKLHVDPLTLSGTCGASGTPSVTAPSWGTTTIFCKADAIGAGCQPGYVCAPKAAANVACALGTTSQSCTGAYAAVNGGTWYQSFSDGRSCGNQCTCGNPVGGSCAGAIVNIYTSGGCGPGGGGRSQLTPPDGCNFANFAWPSSDIDITNITKPTCTSNNTLSGSLTPTNPSLLCCE